MNDGTIDPALMSLLVPEASTEQDTVVGPQPRLSPTAALLEASVEAGSSTLSTHRVENHPNVEQDDDTLSHRSLRNRSFSTSPVFPVSLPLDVQAACFALDSLAQDPERDLDWSVLASRLDGFRRNHRQLQTLWIKLREELSRFNHPSGIKWSRQDDSILRQAVLETEAVGIVGNGKRDSIDGGDANLAKWILVRQRIVAAQEESLGAVVQRWGELLDKEEEEEEEKGEEEGDGDGDGDEHQEETDQKREATSVEGNERPRIVPSGAPSASPGASQAGRPWTQADAMRLEAMKLEGKTDLEVSRELGRSVQSISTKRRRTSKATSFTLPGSTLALSASVTPETVAETELDGWSPVETEATPIASAGPALEMAEPELRGNKRSTSRGAIRTWTADEETTCVRLREAGHTIKQIAVALSRSENAVSARLTTLRHKGLLPPAIPRAHVPPSSTTVLQGFDQNVISTDDHVSLPQTDPRALETASQAVLNAEPRAVPISNQLVPFSDEDDKQILGLHSKHPGRFKQIARQLKPARHKGEVKKRYKELAKRLPLPATEARSSPIHAPPNLAVSTEVQTTTISADPTSPPPAKRVRNSSTSAVHLRKVPKLGFEELLPEALASLRRLIECADSGFQE